MTGRVAVLGTMLELGPQSDELHRQVLEDALARDITMVVATGAFATAADVAAPGPTGAGPEMVVWPDPTRLAPILAQRLRGDEVVLLKASRGWRWSRWFPSSGPSSLRLVSTRATWG